MNLFSTDDPAWSRDFQTALKDLMGEELLLPAPEEVGRGAPSAGPTCVLGVPVAEEQPVYSFTGKALRAAILQRMSVSKTANPYIREVGWAGEKIGQVAQSPWKPFLWVSSADKRTPFCSLTDAACFTVYDFLVVAGELEA